MEYCNGVQKKSILVLLYIYSSKISHGIEPGLNRTEDSRIGGRWEREKAAEVDVRGGEGSWVKKTDLRSAENLACLHCLPY